MNALHEVMPGQDFHYWPISRNIPGLVQLLFCWNYFHPESLKREWYSYPHQQEMDFTAMWKDLIVHTSWTQSFLPSFHLSFPPSSLLSFLPSFPPSFLSPFLPSALPPCSIFSSLLCRALGANSEQELTQPLLWWSLCVYSERYTAHVFPGLTQVFSRLNGALQFVRYVYSNACIWVCRLRHEEGGEASSLQVRDVRWLA